MGKPENNFEFTYGNLESGFFLFLHRGKPDISCSEPGSRPDTAYIVVCSFSQPSVGNDFHTSISPN